MGDNQSRLGDDAVAVEQNVDIDLSGAVSERCLPTTMDFNALDRVQERQRRKASAQQASSIDKAPLVLKPPRFGLIERGDGYDSSKMGQATSCQQNLLDSVSQVAAQAQIDVHHARMRPTYAQSG